MYMEKTRPYLFQLFMTEKKMKVDSSQCFFNGCKAAPGLAFGEPVNLVVQNNYSESNMHAIKKTLSKSKLPLGFVSKNHKTRMLIYRCRKANSIMIWFFLYVCLFHIVLSFKAFEKLVEGLQQMFLSNSFLLM